ncbi:MAG: hypothetical protein KF893_08825 [Caldilineaceae bacterium]|nr:hypothetical protein [Caldilineaceae bacterium]
MRAMLQKRLLWSLDQLMIAYIALLILTLFMSTTAAIYFVRDRLTVPIPMAVEEDPILCDVREYVVSGSAQTQYYYSPNYGWFDSSHFFTGNPARIIQDVRDVVANGSSVITVTQGVRDGITGYSAHYLVSGEIPDEKILGVALGIYQDWSRRFEAWEAKPPHGLFGPFTSFAIEDLPSHYVGFFATVHHVDPFYVLACYLGGVESVENAPPRLAYPENLPGSTAQGELPVQHLVNKTFAPMVWGPGGWRNIPWPKNMRMEAISTSSKLWRFEAEETWYFGQQLTMEGP